MTFEIRNSLGKLIANNLWTFGAAKTEAERLCSESDRQQQFTVVSLEEVWKTKTLRLSDRPGFPIIPAASNQETASDRDRLGEHETAGALIGRVGWSQIIGDGT